LLGWVCGGIGLSRAFCVSISYGVALKAVRVLLEVFVEAQELTHIGVELAKLPEVVDLYEVTGESDLVAMVETDTLAAFRDVLVRKIMQIRGIRSTTSAVILRACKEHSLVT
jgi:DNA-binding Lrp family transcriptional regulator